MEKALVRIRQEQVGEHTEAVNARELHDFLGSRQEFANWIKNRITEYGFTEGEDYLVFKPVVEGPDRFFDKTVKKSNRGRLPIEYLISLDMAKELAMLERTEKGRQARRYFIECEKKLRQLSADLAEMERLDGARAMAALMSRLEKHGRKPGFLRRLIEYRRLGLSQKETGKLLDAHRDTVRRYEAMLKECGFDFPVVRPCSRKKLVDLEVLS